MFMGWWMAGLGMWMVGSCLAVAGPAEERPKLAVTQLADVDEDFALQGEYLGTCQLVTGTCRLGLQVVALGNGRFTARGYPGGLPGYGWNQAEPWTWEGRRGGEALQLLGPMGSVLVRTQDAMLLDAEGAVRGQLQKVTRHSATLGAPPPPGAVVLFDGTHLDQFQHARWTDDRMLAPGAMTRQPVGDFRLHVEFCVPYMPFANNQGRGNSGVYIQQRYEVQILDSFGLEPVRDGCAALYKQTPPRLNMCLPPLAWQTYDIWFTAARWDADGQKIAPARITVWHNGVPVHCEQVLRSKTGAGKPEGPDPRPILFQLHGNPVAFRNIWLVSLEPAPTDRTTCATSGARVRRGRWLERLRTRCCRGVRGRLLPR